MAEQSLGMRIKNLRGAARRDEISKVLSEYRRSKLSAAAFAKSAGIAAVTLSRWQREVRVASREKAPTPPPIVEVRTSTSARPGSFELSLPSGMWLRVPHGFDESELGRLLQALASAC